jgi:hypothetical protein
MLLAPLGSLAFEGPRLPPHFPALRARTTLFGDRPSLKALSPDGRHQGERAMKDPIRIDVGRSSEGATYELHPLARRRIENEFPGGRTAPQVYVGYRTKETFEEVHGPIWKQIAMILTGLSWEEIEKLGGIIIYDAGERREVSKIG